jgi:hypothetical protein
LRWLHQQCDCGNSDKPSADRKLPTTNATFHVSHLPIRFRNRFKDESTSVTKRRRYALIADSVGFAAPVHAFFTHRAVAHRRQSE